MKKTLIVSVVGFIIVLAIAGFGLAACGGDDDNTAHTHIYSTTWSSNATQHWKECTVADCDAKTETANHAPADGICTTCGYDNTEGNNNTPIEMEMVSIPAGTLSWKNWDIEVIITLSAFKIGKFEVTQEQYQAVMGTNPSYYNSRPAVGEVQNKRPVERVTWFDAVEFCNKLSTKEGLTPVYEITERTPATGYPIKAATVTATWENNGYRLPTEAQWEYACRAGTTTNWHFSDYDTELANYAWYWHNSNQITHEVGKKTANAWGLYDMHGNIAEMCWDWYVNANTIPTSDQTDYKGPDNGIGRAARGGSYWDEASESCSYKRNYCTPGVGGNRLGFRVVLP